MNKLDKKQTSTTPENWEDFRPETLLFATEVCMMDRGTKTISVENTGGWGSLAGAIVGFIIVGLLLASFQIMDTVQAPPQNTFKDFAPWKSTRISPVTQIAIGPATKPQKPAVVTPPPKPVIAEETPIVKAQAAEETAQAAAEAKAAEEATQAAAEAKAAEEATQAAAEAEAAEKATQAAAEAKAAKEAAEAKAAEEAAQAAAEAEAAEKATQAAAEAKAAKEAAEAKAAEEAAQAAEEAAQAEIDVTSIVKSWAAAWSDQKVDAYIGSYTSDFKPQQYKHHEYWEAQRRKRLSKPSSISIQLSNIQVSLAEDGTATVTFVQIYKSPTFSDNVRKTLMLKQEADSWRISSEISEKL